jgi:protein-S-isoprenylcysteine O-methyltransferase Ste14
MMTQSEKNEISKISVAKWWEPLASVLILVAVFFTLYKTNISNTFLVVVIMLVLSLFMVACELLKREVPERREIPLKEVLKNTSVKYLGVVFGMFLILFMYWFIPEYQILKYLNPINEAKEFIFILVLICAFPMIFLSEYVLGHKNDGTYNMGLFVTLQIEKIKWRVFRDGILEWLIRLIFLTLNFTSAVKYMEMYRGYPTFFTNLDFLNATLALESIIFFIILIVILPGYLFSWRLIGTDTKKIDSTWFAWTLLLVCYQPFVGPVFQTTFKYVPEVSLGLGDSVIAYYFSGIPIMLYLIGTGIILAALVHLWGEAIIGIRSSNISNKGIITNGPFTFTKHPVYLSKVVGWFLISLPFFNSSSPLESFRLGLAFLVICAIYAGRSLSEEKLLATDPDYVKYALHMDKHATFAFVGRIFPFMSFAWRLNYWRIHNKLN